jgi:hypothetical protein
VCKLTLSAYSSFPLFHSDTELILAGGFGSSYLSLVEKYNVLTGTVHFADNHCESFRERNIKLEWAKSEIHLFLLVSTFPRFVGWWNPFEKRQETINYYF